MVVDVFDFVFDFEGDDVLLRDTDKVDEVDEDKEDEDEDEDEADAASDADIGSDVREEAEDGAA